MPIHFKSAGGSFVGGTFTGEGEIYTSDALGSGEVRKGTFRRGKLGGLNCTLINYTNTSFTSYSGPFSNGKMHGTIQVLSYERAPGDPVPDGEAECTGNGTCGTLNICFVHAAAACLPLVGTKKEMIYSAGALVEEVSTAPCTMCVTISQKEHGPKFIFTEFAVTED